MIVGTVLWWPLLSPLPEYPRLSYPMQIMYLFLLMIPMTAVGAPITMAKSVIYVFYMIGPHPFGLTPIADQVLGGTDHVGGAGRLHHVCLQRDIPALGAPR